ncbi:MAG: thiamine pyrophosphate-binding protein [Alphaproteobacteria bacterium]|nr:thiamine pyrophosphate-binding protein [Alphaproteobacteria bacterium]
MSDLTKYDRPVNIGNPQMGWASDVAAEMLRRMGIKYLSMNPGASYRGFHDSIVNYLGNSDPQMILCLHEDHAVHIAQGYAKATNEPMGCILHSNVGLMHGMMGIFNAWCNRVPMIIMGATGPVDAPKRRPWIDWIHTCKDQGALIRNFTKWDDEPRSAQALAESMVRANKIMRTAPTGPVYMCLDAGLQETAIDSNMKLPDISRYQPAPPPPPPAETVEKVAEMLAKAKNPIIMVGRCSRSQEGWDARVKLAELLGAGVVTDMKVGAGFPTDHPLHLAPAGNRLRAEAVDEMKKADVILDLNWIDLAGTFKLVYGRDEVKAKIVHVSVDSYSHNGWSMDHMGLPIGDIAILADPDVTTLPLLAAVEKKLGGKSKWDGKNKGRTAEPEPSLDGVDPNSEITPEYLSKGVAIARARSKAKLSLNNVLIGWDPDFYHFRTPLDYLGNDAGGGLAAGPGTTIGAALALKDTDWVAGAVIGDGDFMQGGSSVWTAAHYQIPALFIIGNNGSNFNDEIHQETVAHDRGRPPENQWIGMRIAEPELDIAAYAKAQGVDSIGPVKTVGELVPAIEKGIAAAKAGKPFLVDVHVKRAYAAPHPPRTA